MQIRKAMTQAEQRSLLTGIVEMERPISAESRARAVGTKMTS